MMDQPQTPTDAAPGPDAWKTPPALKVITDNFAVLSATTIVIAVLAATVFVWGYFAVFDYQLIWIVEYVDILKVGLLAVGLIAATVTPLLGSAFTGHDEPIRLGILGGIVVLGIVITIVGIFLGTTVPGGILSAIWYLIATVLTGTWPWLFKYSLQSRKLVGALWLAVWTIALIFAWGYSVGCWARYWPSKYSHDVFLKDKSLENVRIVMLTSHHTVVLSNDHVIIFPANDVTRIVGREREQIRGQAELFF